MNEGDVEWPPSPWRILRALIAVWYRKADTDLYPMEVLKELIEALSTSFPVYSLPPAVHSHTRHYMPAKNDPTLVYDAFARVSADEKLIVAWLDVVLTDPQRELLSHLLGKLGYLGRAESWVDVKLLSDWTGSPNCYPAGAGHGVDNPNELMHSIQVGVPAHPDEFTAWHARIGQSKGTKGWLPNSLFEALSVDTGELEKGGWSSAPGMKSVVYLRPAEHLTTQSVIPKRQYAKETYNVARFALGGRLLPQWTDALMMGELLHLALMGQGGTDVPSTISGRDANDEVLKAGHRHGYCLPEDIDGDGRIDHLLFVSKDEFPDSVLMAIENLASKRLLWTPKHWPGPEREWPVYLELLGNTNRHQSLRSHDAQSIPLLGVSRVWRSCTPYLHPWFAKKHGRFGPAEQIAKELHQRGFPEPILMEEFRQIPLGMRAREAYPGDRLLTREKFRHRRVGRPDQRSPDQFGSFWTLHFLEPISGPLALGFSCHYGLGMFVPGVENLAHV